MLSPLVPYSITDNAVEVYCWYFLVCCLCGFSELLVPSPKGNEHGACHRQRGFSSLEHLIQSLLKSLGVFPVDLKSRIFQAGAGFDGLQVWHTRHNGLLVPLQLPGSCAEPC